MTKKQYYQRNTKLLPVISGVRSAIFIMAVLVPFFQKNGLDQTQIMLIQAIFAITAATLELPSGDFADRFGNRLSIILGCSCWGLGNLIYGFSNAFAQFAVAEMIFGVAAALLSGSIQAMLSDSLRAIKRYDARYRSDTAKIFRYSLVSHAIASMVGGTLVVRWLSIETNWFLGFAASLVAISLSFLLVDPPTKRSQKDNPIKEIIKLSHYALHGHQEIKWAIFLRVFVGSSTYLMVWLWQPYYQLVGIPLHWFGVVWFCFIMMTALATEFTGKIERNFSERKVVLAMLIMPPVGYFLLSAYPAIPVLLLGIILLASTRGVSSPILDHNLDKHIQSGGIRATIHSVSGLCMMLSIAVLGPMVGLLTDHLGLTPTLASIGIALAVFALLIVSKLHKYKQI